MKVGARNDIKATVSDIKQGDVMSKVKVILKGTEIEMSSVMTTESVQALALKPGDEVRVIAKAINVMLAK